MMRRFMIESVCYWAREYHIDGFRFDLMGIHDIETMNAIRQALDKIDPTICMYGEGWAAGKPQLPDSLLAMKKHAARLPHIGMFCDEMRDSLRGRGGNDAKGAFCHRTHGIRYRREVRTGGEELHIRNWSATRSPPFRLSGLHNRSR